MQLQSLQRFAAVAAIAILAACHDSTGPKIQVDGDYMLDAVGGKPLPVLMLTFNGVDTYVTAMQVHLDAGAQAFTVAERDSVIYSPAHQSIATSSYGGGLQTAGTALTFTQNFNSTGSVDANGFTLTRAQGNMHFRRVQ